LKGGAVAGATPIRDDFVGAYLTRVVQRGRVTLWLAPALGCAQLKMRVTDRRDATKTVFEKDPLIVEHGEPDPALFLTPVHYREVLPSVILKLAAGSPEAMRLDAAYRSRQTDR
jgi:hypothetical protein